MMIIFLQVKDVLSISDAHKLFQKRFANIARAEGVSGFLKDEDEDDEDEDEDSESVVDHGKLIFQLFISK